MTEKNVEKLDYDLLTSSIDSSVIPVVTSFEDFNKPTDTTKNQPVVDPDEYDDEDEPIETVASLASLESNEPVIKPVVKADNKPQPTENEAVGLAKFFAAKGYLDFDEEGSEDIDEEWVENKVLETLTSRAEETLAPEIKYINDLYKKGVSLETLINSHINTTNLKDITEDKIEDDEKVAEFVIRKYFSEILETEDSEIDSTIEDFKDAGIITKQALKFKPKLDNFYERRVKLEERQVEQERAENVRKENERLSVLRKIVDSTPTFINGVEIASKTDKDKLYTGITKKDRDGLTEYQKMLMDPDMQLKVAQFVLLYNADFKNVEDKLKTKLMAGYKKQTNTYTDQAPKDPKKIASEALSYIKRHARK